jgi:putative nucleotidyltransferase with HDIG domain
MASNSPYCKRGFWQSFLFCSTGNWLCRINVCTALVVLSLILCSHFYAQPKLSVGTLVNRDLVAPVTTTVRDVDKTRSAQEQAMESVAPVFRIDDAATQQARQSLHLLLQTGDRLRELAGRFPISGVDLSLGTQAYLRSLPEEQWQQIDPQRSWQSPVLPSTVRAELTAIRIATPEAYDEMWQAIASARARYQTAQQELKQAPLVLRQHLLAVSDAEWYSVKSAVVNGLNALLEGGIPVGLSPEMLQQRITSLRWLPAGEAVQTLFVAILQEAVQPNLRLDYAATRANAIAAAQSVQPAMTEIKAGTVIVKAGQQITERQFAILDELGMTQRQPNWNGIALVICATAGAVGLLVLLVHKRVFRLHNADAVAIFFTSAAIALAGVLMIPHAIAYLPLASAGLIVGSFYCRRLAVLITVLLAGLLALSTAPSFSAYLPIVAGALLAGGFTNRPRARSHLAAIGVLVGVVQAVLFGAIALFFGQGSTLVILAQALQYGAGGLISAILALGAIPYLEQVSYALTPFRLAELADLDRPLLRRLVTEAPGTFQHTLFVANLAEAAARELNADTALVRTGTLYHDIGKTLKPEYFIENQMGCSNPHDSLDDPWRSAQIIKEHVTGGLKLAQQYRLPKQLQAFIPEHQGTIVISYFYHKARQQFPDLEDDDFRYDGPIPQSRETGIVMLADACEAALRSLGQDADVVSAKEMVLRIFQARQADGQLDACGLTAGELDRIAEVFIKVWQERNHGRIKYPALYKKLDPTGSTLPQAEDTTTLPQLVSKV